MRGLLFTITIFLFTAFTPLVAQEGMEGLRYGKLENGLTYYVKHSKADPGRVSFYLLQNVGSILEEDHENGLAHFLEHMAFNGTTHFPGGVMPYLRGKGIFTFNARTGINQTVYNIEDVPTADGGLVDTCMFIVKDWCNEILLKEKDIDDERGVIIEEWRSHYDVGRRLQEGSAPVVYNHTKYARRNVIGSVELLKSFPYDVLREFYHKWYRPDLQCVIIVGDVDEVEYESKVKEMFGQIPARVNPLERYEVEIPDRADLDYMLILDPENRSKMISFHQRAHRVDGLDELERKSYSFKARIFNAIWGQRLARIVNANQEKFLSAAAEFGSFVRNYNGFSLDIVPYKDKDVEAFEQVWTVWEEIRRFGFTDVEVERVQEALFQELQKMESAAEKESNPYYVSVFQSHFLSGLPFREQSEELDVLKEALLEITPEDMNTWIHSWATDSNRIIVVSGNDKDYNYLTKEQALDIMAKVAEKDIQPEVIEHKTPEGFDLKLQAGTIKKVKKLDRFKAEEWTLSNGARVFYKYVEEGDGFFSMACSSHGGRSVVDAEDLPTLAAMQALAMKSGLYKYDLNTLKDLVQGKQIRLNMMVSDYTEGFGGSTKADNAELLFQLYYLMFEEPRFDRPQFDKYVERAKYMYENRRQTPQDLVQDSIRKLTTRIDDRNRDWGAAYFDKMNFERMKSLYRERFSNAKEFTFCIVGDIDRDEAARLTCEYIGSLPSRKGKKEEYIIRNYDVDTDTIAREFKVVMPGDKGMVNLMLENDGKFSDKKQMALTIWGQMLRNRLFAIVREQESATYGVNVDANCTTFPYRKATLMVGFETQRDKVERMKEIIYNELERSKDELFLESELSPILISIRRMQDQQGENIGIDYWMNVLNTYAESKVDATNHKAFDKMLESMTVEDVRNAARKFLKNVKVRDWVIKSEEVNPLSDWEK